MEAIVIEGHDPQAQRNRFYCTMLEIIERLHRGITGEHISSILTIHIDTFEKIVLANSNAGNFLTDKHNKLFNKHLFVWKQWYDSLSEIWDGFAWRIDHTNKRFVIEFNANNRDVNGNEVVYTTYIFWLAETKKKLRIGGVKIVERGILVKLKFVKNAENRRNNQSQVS